MNNPRGGTMNNPSWAGKKTFSELTDADIAEMQAISAEHEYKAIKHENSIGGQPREGETYMDTLIKGAKKLNKLKSDGKLDEESNRNEIPPAGIC